MQIERCFLCGDSGWIAFPAYRKPYARESVFEEGSTYEAVVPCKCSRGLEVPTQYSIGFRSYKLDEDLQRQVLMWRRDQLAGVSDEVGDMELGAKWVATAFRVGRKWREHVNGDPPPMCSRIKLFWQKRQERGAANQVQPYKDKSYGSENFSFHASDSREEEGDLPF